MKASEIDRLIGKNLRRLRAARGLSQKALADSIDTPAPRISAYENGIEGMGKDIMTRICNVLHVQPYEFYLAPGVPMAADEEELELLEKMREARELGIIDGMIDYANYLIAKHTKERKRETKKKAG